MRKQRPPTIDDKSYLDEIIKAKNNPRKKRLLLIKDGIKVAYDNFSANLGAVHNVAPVGIIDPEKADLEHCYESVTQPLSELKEEIKSNLTKLDRDLCPYCGIREPDEFDHYLPKYKFSEFSVFSKNLIWSCHRCNHTKLEQHGNGTFFLNSYYTSLPLEKFLFCEIEVFKTRLEFDFYLKKPKSFNDEDFKIISSHFEKLNLRESYIKMAAQTVPSLIKRWIKMSESNTTAEVIEIAKKTLVADIFVGTQDHGLSYYEVVLLEECLVKILDLLQFGHNNFIGTSPGSRQLGT